MSVEETLNELLEKEYRVTDISLLIAIVVRSSIAVSHTKRVRLKLKNKT